MTRRPIHLSNNRREEMERLRRPIRDNRREEIDSRIPIRDNRREEIEDLMPPDFFDSEGQLREDLLNSDKVSVNLMPDQRVLEVTLIPDNPGEEIKRLRIQIPSKKGWDEFWYCWKSETIDNCWDKINEYRRPFPTDLQDS